MQGVVKRSVYSQNYLNLEEISSECWKSFPYTYADHFMCSCNERDLCHCLLIGAVNQRRWSANIDSFKLSSLREINFHIS